MLEHHLFDSAGAWRRRSRPMVLALFSYRYDADLVPDLLANIEPVVDGWIAFDDRGAGDLFSSEPGRRRLLVQRAKELGATWVLAIDPDERIERGAATRIRLLTSERQRIIWEFNLREMFTAATYRVDGIWGTKMQGRLFPTFDGPLCSDQALHGAWCVAPRGYSVIAAGLNLYHLKMLSFTRRQARRELYQHLDPTRRYQTAGYDYLVDDTGAEFEQIPPARDFFPAHREPEHSNIYMADVRRKVDDSGSSAPATTELHGTTDSVHLTRGTVRESQLGQLRISIGDHVRHYSKLAIVVIGLGAPKSLFNAVRSLLLQDAPAEIIVVNSGGGNVSRVLGEYLRSVVLVELSEPVFVGAARNIGIQVSRAPFVAFLAADCVATPGWASERTKAHMEGERAVASVVDNDRPRNPFAWAAHLMTYGHRMAETGRDAGAYGASYDRSLFKKYGHFSETMVVGEDSEFHSRFRQSDPVFLHASIRTIHRNPAGPISFLADQFHRGMRGRYLADFFGIDFTLRYIASATVGRVARPIRVSATRLQPPARRWAIASWPLLPIGAFSYLIGMVVSYVKATTAERYCRQADQMALLGQLKVGIDLLRRAIALRPATARYHLALAALLKSVGEYDEGARELHSGWDIDRRRIIELYRAGDSIGLVDPKINRLGHVVNLELVVFSDRSDMELAEFLRAVSVQNPAFNKLKVLVVESRGDPEVSQMGHQLRQSYAHFARFVSSEQMLTALSSVDSHGHIPTRCFVIVSSCSCLPPPDWFTVLKAYITTYPEIELFQGSCQPRQGRRAGFMEGVNYDLGLFPQAGDNGGVLHFSPAANWACDKSLLMASGGLMHDKAKALGARTLTERAMKTGGSILYAPDWQIQFRVDAGLMRLLRRFYQDGYYAAKHLVVTRDRDLVTTIFSTTGLRGSFAAAWRFAVARLKVWRFASRSLLLQPPVFLLLLMAGISRQAGWRAGLKQFGDDIFRPAE